MTAVLLAGCTSPAESAPDTSAQQALTQARAMPSGFWRSAVEQVHEQVHAVREETRAEMVKGVNAGKFTRGDRNKRQICFTFDDGPHPGKTEPLLRILAENHVKATFFVVGKMAEKYPHLVRMESYQGHEVGNHTYNHVNLTKLDRDKVKTEILACDGVLRSILGNGSKVLRPPGGQYNSDTIDIARGMGYTTVLWTDDPGDYDEKIPADVVLQRTIRDASPGGVILLHDGIDSTMQMLPRLITYLREQGYSFLTAGEMLAQNGN